MGPYHYVPVFWEFFNKICFVFLHSITWDIFIHPFWVLKGELIFVDPCNQFVCISIIMCSLYGGIPCRSIYFLGHFNYSWTLVMWPLLGRSKIGHIRKVVTLSRRFAGVPQVCYGDNDWIYREIQTGRAKSGNFRKVVTFSGWSHSKVLLYYNMHSRDGISIFAHQFDYLFAKLKRIQS